MDALKFSVAITKHVASLAQGTRLAGKVGMEQKTRIKPTASLSLPTPTSPPGVATRWASGKHEYAEIDNNLFFFYSPATIVRWPKPVEGERQNFAVRIEKDSPSQEQTTKLTHADLEDNSDVSPGDQAFRGRFRIDSDGTLVTLIIHPVGETAIDVVVLGNPGGEVGSNGSC